MFKSCRWCGGIHPFATDRCRKNRYRIGFDGKPRTDEGYKYRNNSKFMKLSSFLKEERHNLCAACLVDGVINSQRIEVHHIEKISEKPELAYDISNLICLCSQHHRQAERGELSKEYLRKINPPGVQRVC